jgi:hypothetical protein
MTILEKIAITKVYSKLKANKKQEMLISNLLKEIDQKHHQFYIDFFLGYLRYKPKALKEDLKFAFDVARFYKSKPERFEFRTIKPIKLGSEKFKEITYVFNEHLKSENKSKIQIAKRNGVLIDGVALNVLYEDDEYKIYFIPKLKKGYSPEQLNEQHLRFCVVGKDTNWCTAHPDGSYYEEYVTDDIYTIHRNDVPLIQFNIRKNKINQMMNINDEEIKVIDKNIINILEKVFKEKNNET